jgi:hypothetical protein
MDERRVSGAGFLSCEDNGFRGHIVVFGDEYPDKSNR